MRHVYFLVIIGLLLSCKKDEPVEPTANCTNGIQDGDETGIDCGGSCPSCFTPAEPFEGYELFTSSDEIDCFDVYPGFDAHIVVATSNALGQSLQLSTDGGANWTTITSPSATDIKDFKFPWSDQLFALDLNGNIYKSTTEGASWSQLFPGESLNSISMIGIRDTLLGLSNYRLYLSTDAGGTWNQVFNGSTIGGRTLEIAERIAGDDIIMTTRDVATANYFVHTSNDHGLTWSEVSSISGSNILDFHFEDSQTGYAVGPFTGILKTLDQGATWTIHENTFSNGVHVYINDTTGVAISNNPYFTINSGSSFEQLLYNDGTPQYFSYRVNATGQPVKSFYNSVYVNKTNSITVYPLSNL